MISVNDLVAVEQLGLEIVAGHEGGDRLVSWAHTVDLPDPWRWVAAGDLLMTTGLGMPTEPAAQADWLGKLADSQVSALVVAPGPDAPGISDEMAARAHSRRFPLLLASFDLEFVKLSRIVIGSALQSQRDRLAASQRLFDAYADSLRGGADFTGRLENLGRRLSWRLEVQDVPSGQLIASSGSQHAEDVEVVSLAVPGRGNVVLKVWPRHSQVVVDPLLVHYLAGLVGIELETQAIDRDTARKEGEALLRDLIAGSVDLAAARTVLARRGLQGELVVLAIASAGPALRSASDIQHAPELALVYPLFLVEDDTLIAVTGNDEDFIRRMTSALGSASRTGVSAPVTTAGGMAEGVRQAKLALTHARHGRTANVHYGTEPDEATLTPKSVAEARALVERFLGPLIDYDEQKHTSLVATLAAFLASDGNWTVTATELHIHRQTLVYRLRTVEKLTGLKPTSTAGTASFWLSLQAGRAAGILST